MYSFSKKTLKTLAMGAVLLAMGVYYQTFAAHSLKQAQDALRRVESAQSRAEETKQSVEQYLSLLAVMSDKNMEQQEPFSVVSEFSPQEISQLAPLLENLYQRDGHFFLKHLNISWRDAKESKGLLPRVTLELDGRKVLLFSSEGDDPSLITTAKR